MVGGNWSPYFCYVIVGDHNIWLSRKWCHRSEIIMSLECVWLINGSFFSGLDASGYFS